MPIEIKPEGRFGNYLHAAMERQGIDVKALATEIESTYEHIRKLIKSTAFPSNSMLDNIAAALKGNFDRKEALLFVEQDRAQKRFKNFHVMTGRHPQFDRLEKVWPQLSESHREDLFRMAEMWAREDKRGAVAAGGRR
jgi:transcriptional regulator with XRE-family HTH domain